MPLTVAEKLWLLKVMVTSRAGDLREQSLLRQGQGWFHVSGMGHEALAALGAQLRPEDYLFPHYRDRALVMAGRLSNFDLALAFFAKRDSSSGGRQMPGHFSSRAHRIFSLPSVVTANLLPACGVAWGLRLDGAPGVVVASCGDASTRQGEFFEALSFAREKSLPVLFLVEDNGLGISSCTVKTNPLALGVLDRSAWREVDGTDLAEVHAASEEALDRLRSGGGPVCFWMRVERISSHSSADDHRKYRPAEELARIADRDPLERLRRELAESGHLDEAAYAALRQGIEAEVRRDYERAREEVDPDASDLLTHVYGEGGTVPPLPLDLGARTRLVDAVNGVFHTALRSGRSFVFFGQDIEDPKGGVFSLTKGLSTADPERVCNSPLAEATILGVACGLAAYGKFPVFELQFIDFLPPGFNQLITNLATLRWRTRGDWSCPCVIYAPYGAYLPGGSLWHSQTNESALAHFPGLKICVPSNPEDAAGLIWSALHGDDPVLVLVPKHLLWREQPLAQAVSPVPLGKARLRREGNDLTVLTWGNGVEVAEEALAALAAEVRADLLDLRTVLPWDFPAVAASVRKTGRLVIVQEDAENCSIGQMIISRLVADPSVWERLLAPPALVAKPNVSIGYNPVLEYAAVPGVERVVQAIRQTMDAAVVRPPAGPAGADPAAGPAPKLTLAFSDDLPEGEREIRLIQVPQLGEGITHARLIRRMKEPGEEVRCDEAVCELETDKALFPVESPHRGVVKAWLVENDREVEVGQKLLEVEVTVAPAIRPAPSGAGRPGSSAAPAGGAPAEERKSSPTEGGLAPHIVSQLKNVVPTHMAMTAGWGRIAAERRRVREQAGGVAPSPTVMLAWCIVRAMEKHPIFCCTINAHDTLSPQPDFDFGVAVALARDALDTAVIPRARHLDWPRFESAYQAAVAAARAGRPASKARAPLILTSMGGFQVRFALPVVVPPALATLFVGEAHPEPRPGGEGGDCVNLCLSFDHRWINGVAGAAFLADVRAAMEQFRLP